MLNKQIELAFFRQGEDFRIVKAEVVGKSESHALYCLRFEDGTHKWLTFSEIAHREHYAKHTLGAHNETKHSNT